MSSQKKLVKVYLTSSKEDELSFVGRYTFGVILSEGTKKRYYKYKKRVLEYTFYTVEPIYYIPDKVSKYIDYKDVEFVKKPQSYTRIRKKEHDLDIETLGL